MQDPTQQTEKFLSTLSAKPFLPPLFLYLSHLPLKRKEEAVEKERMAREGGEVRFRVRLGQQGRRG